MATTLYRAIKQSPVAAAVFYKGDGAALRARMQRVSPDGLYRLTDFATGEMLEGSYHHLVAAMRAFAYSYGAGQAIWTPVADHLDLAQIIGERPKERPEFPTYVGSDGREHAEF